ncbi:MAG TPA: glycosyl transferase family 1, partial [Planctomycetota bacterium]|nr:glycosyl transferase family 1 [Planctomycetota bacterium]
MDRSGRRARFDQQPIDVMSLVEACAEAYYCTREPVWMERARLITGWFLGSNDTQSMIYDYSTGGCRDGLHSNGPNLNEGAESTLAWLISLCIVYRLEAEATASEEIPSVNDATLVPS